MIGRRGVISVAAIALTGPAGLVVPALAEDESPNGIMAYRSFVIDVSAAAQDRQLIGIERSVKHQVDIVADCGAKPVVLDFFRSQRITLTYGHGDGGGHFSAGDKGVTVDAAVDAPEKPIILHELLHAYHFRVLPDGFRNRDVLIYY